MALPKIIAILLPFVLGYFLYLIANPLNKQLKKRLPPSLSAFLSLFIISLLLFFILWMLFSHLATEIVSFSASNSLYKDAIPFLSRQINAVSSSAEGVFGNLFDAFYKGISNILFKISLLLFDFVKNIPALLIAAFTTVFTAFFLLKDTAVIYAGAKKFFGEKLCLKFSDMKNSFFSVIFTYFKAQLIIESIIFAVLFLGFSFLKVRYALLLAFFTAIVDAFPILGTGAVLVPGAIVYFLAGNPMTGWGMLVLYGVAVLTRQLCEPKIIGDKLGIHPLATIFSIYAGLKLFGFWGLILGPIVSILVKNIFLAKKT